MRKSVAKKLRKNVNGALKLLNGENEELNSKNGSPNHRISEETGEKPTTQYAQESDNAYMESRYK